MNTIENQEQATKITAWIFNNIAPLMSHYKTAASEGQNKRQLKIDSKAKAIKVIKLDKTNASADSHVAKQSEKDVFDRVSRRKTHSNGEETMDKDLKSLINQDKRGGEREPREKRVIKINKQNNKYSSKEETIDSNQKGFDKAQTQNLSTEEERKKRMMRFGTTVEAQEVPVKRQKTAGSNIHTG